MLDGPTELDPIVLTDDWALNADGSLSPLDAWLDSSDDWCEPGDDEPVDGRLESSLDSGEPLGWDDGLRDPDEPLDSRERPSENGERLD